MQKWQYYVMTLSLHSKGLRTMDWKCGQADGLQAIQDVTNELGADGWELVGVMPVALGYEGSTTGAHLWFKRPTSEQQARAYLSQREEARQHAADAQGPTNGRGYVPVKCPGCGRTVTAGAARCGACGASVEPRLAGHSTDNPA